MKRIGLPMMYIVIAALWSHAAIIATTGAQESTTASDRKPSVNFSGIILTHTGDGYWVDNITVGGLVKKFKGHHMPSEEYLDKQHMWLLIDPSSGGQDKTNYAEMDLAEIDMIEVPNPKAIWHFLKPEERKKFNPDTKQPAGREFIEIKVTKNDGNVFNYLIELNKKIKADIRKVLSEKDIDLADYPSPDNEKEAREIAQEHDAKQIVNQIKNKLDKKVRKTGKRKTPEESYFAYPSLKRLIVGDYTRRDEISDKCPACPPCAFPHALTNDNDNEEETDHNDEQEVNNDTNAKKNKQKE